MASIDAWERDPEPMWTRYLSQREQAAQAEPHAGHRAFARAPVITQNIDNLHERGGSAEVVHLHGCLFEFRCTICSCPYRGILSDAITHCLLCGNPIRPEIFWFGEMLPLREWNRAEELIRGCDLLIMVGTSGIVQPATSLPLPARYVIEISPDNTALSDMCDYSWRSTAAGALPALLDCV